MISVPYKLHDVPLLQHSHGGAHKGTEMSAVHRDVWTDRQIKTSRRSETRSREET